MLSESRSMLGKAKEDMAWYYNQHWVLAPEYHIGDKVYLDASDIYTTCPSQKLAHHYLGPFTVTWQVSWNKYCLWLLTSMSQLHPVFNIVKLLQALEDPIPGQKAHPPPPLEMVDGEEHYIVEHVKILSWCVIIRDRQMKVLHGTRGRLRYMIDSGRPWSMVVDGSLS